MTDQERIQRLKELREKATEPWIVSRSERFGNARIATSFGDDKRELIADIHGDNNIDYLLELHNNFEWLIELASKGLRMKEVPMQPGWCRTHNKQCHLRVNCFHQPTYIDPNETKADPAKDYADAAWERSRLEGVIEEQTKAGE